MATIADLEKLARKITGRPVQVQKGDAAVTNGEQILVLDTDALWPRLPERARDDMDRVLAGHEASHIVMFEREARKAGKASMSSEEFYQQFADPFSPGADSRDYVRFLLNMVEDQLVNEHAARFVGQDRCEQVSRFFIWNRQSGRRLSLAELEASGSTGRCAAFVEALFQLEPYGELLESFYSPALERAAKEASRAIELFGQGSLSRTQALEAVLKALARYCSPPWTFLPEYQPPRGQSQQQGNGQGQGSGSGSGGQQDQSGQGQGRAGQRNSQGGGSQNQGQGSQGQGQGSGQAGQSQPQSGSQSQSGQQSGQQGGAASGSQKSGQKGEEYSESSGGGGSPDGSQSRGAETGAKPGIPEWMQRADKPVFEDNNLEALLRMLERVLMERSNQTGRGIPRWKTWSPGDQISGPDELQRYWEDESFGINPLERRCVRHRDKKRHLLAVFIDSSGSVDNRLFSQLYRVMGELAEKVADLEGCFLGVGQFSGGASWVLEPTRDVAVIREFAEEEPKRLYRGGTTVGEIYGLLPEWFAGYQTADLVVLTDGYVEDSKALAVSLEHSHNETQCEIKLHGVVFQGQGTLRQFRKAKDELPQFIRTWHLGE